MVKDIEKINYNLNLLGNIPIDGNYLFGNIIPSKLLFNKDALYRGGHKSGKLINISYEDIEPILVNGGGRKIVDSGTTNIHTLYMWEDAWIQVVFNKKDSTITISVQSLNQKVMDLYLSLKEFISEETKNLVYAIVQGPGGLEAKLIGKENSSLIEDNYHPEVINDFNYVVGELGKTDPNGRITILDGEPGTGKTYLIRAMLSQIDAVFLIVHASLIASLDGPQFLPTLLSLKDTNKPIILIVEDGDQILVPRKNDNMSSISSLLNLSDGIMGALIDLRLIISTNASITEMDEAIMRPGRLCRRIGVGPLDFEQASRIYKNISQKEITLPSKRKYTLAEIYAMAKNMESYKIKIDKKSIGFVTKSNINNSNQLLNCADGAPTYK